MVAAFMNQLETSTADQLRDVGGVRSYGAGSYLFHEGDSPSSVQIVLAGLLRIDRTTPSARVLLLDLATVGDPVGELGVIDDRERSATASSVTDCQVLQVPAQAFRDLMRTSHDLQTHVMHRLTRRLRALSTQLLETSTMDAASRIAARLVRLVAIEQHVGRSEPAPDGSIDLRLPINQEELGQWSGLSREGAVKGLTALRSDGLIETGRKRVHILDFEALCDRAAPI